MNSRLSLAAAALVAALSLSAAALAQRVEYGRGDITAIDANRGEVELRDPQGHVRTWRFERDATVKVTDDSRPFPRNPTSADLRPPMYVHFTYVNDVIRTFDVIEIRAQAGDSGGTGGTSGRQQGTSRTVSGRVTAYDPNVRQVEIDHDGKRETFQITSRSDRRLSPGDRVQLRTEWTGAREQVIEVRLLGRDRGDLGRDRGDLGRDRGDGDRTRGTSYGGSETAEGRVVRISTNGVVMQVAGAERIYWVDDSQLLRQLRVGDTVRFDWRTDRNGRMYLTDVR